MIEQFDLYGTSSLSVPQVTELVALALAVDFRAHHSGYAGGDYYLWQGEQHAQLKVVQNAPDDEGYLLEPDFPDMPVLVFASCLAQASNAALRGLAELQLLRSEVL